MPYKLIPSVALFLASVNSTAQDSAWQSPKVNRSNIVVITKSGASIEARVVQITIDYIILDASPFNGPLKLSAYYIRPAGDYFKIEVEYLQAAILKVKKNKGGVQTVSGAVAGAHFANSTIEEPFENLGQTGAVTAAGLGVGALVGTAKGMGRKKLTVPIYGMPENLIALANYFR